MRNSSKRAAKKIATNENLRSIILGTFQSEHETQKAASFQVKLNLPHHSAPMSHNKAMMLGIYYWTTNALMNMDSRQCCLGLAALGLGLGSWLAARSEP